MRCWLHWSTLWKEGLQCSLRCSWPCPVPVRLDCSCDWNNSDCCHLRGGPLHHKEMPQKQQNSQTEAKYRALQFRQHNKSIHTVNLEGACFPVAGQPTAWTTQYSIRDKRIRQDLHMLPCVCGNLHQWKHVLQLYLIMYGYIWNSIHCLDVFSVM